jgi:hypothetical protein
MRRSIHALVVLVISITAFAGPASADSLDAREYRRGVEKAMDRWVEKVKPFDLDIGLARVTIAALSAQNPKLPGTDDQIAALTAGIKGLLAKVEQFNSELKADIALLPKEVAASKTEGPQLPGQLKQLIAAKGIPVNKTVSIGVPDVKWDQKNDRLGNITIILNIRNLAPLSN